MIELNTDEQKREYELELARIKARAETQLNENQVREAYKSQAKIQFQYTFWIAIVGACVAFLLGVMVNK